MESKAQREPKHIELDNAILRLSEIIHNIDALIDDVGDATPKTGSDAAVKGVPTLVEILNEGPERINSFINHANDGLNHLRSIIL